MHIPTHVLSGWVLGNLLPLRPRERLFCMIVAGIPDIDGFGFFISEDLYWDLHHSLGHNVFFGILVAGIFTFWSDRRLIAFFAYLFCFHLHLAMDYVGSGPGWMIHYLWPVTDRGWKTPNAWPLSSWQNYLTFAILLAATIAIAVWKRRSPLELLAPRLEQKLIRRD